MRGGGIVERGGNFERPDPENVALTDYVRPAKPRLLAIDKGAVGAVIDEFVLFAVEADFAMT